MEPDLIVVLSTHFSFKLQRVVPWTYGTGKACHLARRHDIKEGSVSAALSQI